jgi:tetratricopeptide (TPR) repeat protein
MEVVMAELEALRIDVMRGEAATALPEIESRLAKIEGWWRASRAGAPPPEAPDREALNRAMTSALDVARQAHLALEQWEAALARIDAIVKVKKELRRPEEDIAITRFNRAPLLEALRRFGEAKSELEYCLDIFADDPGAKSKVLGALASLYADLGDFSQAVSQERRALAICESLPNPADRASSHNNLGNHLERRGGAADRAESARHRLGALAYRLVAGLDLRTLLHNYAIDFRRAAAAGAEPPIPRLAELLADPAFNALKQWLAQRQFDPEELQKAIDDFLAHARQAAAQAGQPQEQRQP